MPGPAPKLNPVRRNARSGPVMLPAKGREGYAPLWPLEGQTDAEAAVWLDLWATPQAVAWETLGWLRTVARYCRLLVQAEEGDAPVTLLAEVRHLEDRLGLTPMSMRRLLWQIAPDEVGEKREEHSSAEDDLARRRRLAARRKSS